MARIRVKKPVATKIKPIAPRKRGTNGTKGASEKPATPLSAEALIRKAEEQGFLNSSDILSVYPEAEENLTQLDDLFTYLQDRDIDVVEDESEDKKSSSKEETEPEIDAEDEREVELAADLSEIAAWQTIGGDHTQKERHYAAIIGICPLVFGL